MKLFQNGQTHHVSVQFASSRPPPWILHPPAPICTGHCQTCCGMSSWTSFHIILGIAFSSLQHYTLCFLGFMSSFFFHVSFMSYLPLFLIPQQLPKEGHIGDKFFENLHGQYLYSFLISDWLFGWTQKSMLVITCPEF